MFARAWCKRGLVLDVHVFQRDKQANKDLAVATFTWFGTEHELNMFPSPQEVQVNRFGAQAHF